jgi:hypothetical protein
MRAATRGSRHPRARTCAHSVAHALGPARTALSLQAYLIDRMTRQAWTLTQIASELGTHRDTVRDRLDRYGLRPIRQTAREPGRLRPADDGLAASNSIGAYETHRGQRLLLHGAGRQPLR